MSRTNLRRVHIAGREWKYITNLGGARIFFPGTKRSVDCVVPEREDGNGFMTVTPAGVKAYIEGHLEDFEGGRDEMF